MTGGGRPRPRLTLLARAYCHLCDVMHDDLAPLAARYGAEVVVVDVDADAALDEAYGERVPVLLLGVPPTGRELCHFRLDAGTVTEALASDTVFR